MTIGCRSRWRQSEKPFKNVPGSDVVQSEERKKNETILRIFLPALWRLKKERVALLPLTIVRLLSKRHFVELDRYNLKHAESLLHGETELAEKRRKVDWKSWIPER